MLVFSLPLLFIAICGAAMAFYLACIEARDRYILMAIGVLEAAGLSAIVCVVIGAYQTLKGIL